MEEGKIVKIARTGDVVKEIGATPGMTVEEIMRAAGYSDHTGKIWGKREDGSSSVVQMSDLVNGYVAFVPTTDVKGGAE